MLINDSAPNHTRTQGRAFSGFKNPITGKIHREQLVTKEEREEVLLRLHTSYFSLYGIAHGGFENFEDTKSPKLKASNPDEIRILLETAAKHVPFCKSRVGYVQTIMDRRGKEPTLRVILLPKGDRKSIPPEYYKTFRYWFIEELSASVLGGFMNKSFDAVMNLTAFEARKTAAKCSKTSRQIYEEILDQAFLDAELTLEPLLSRAPTADNALMLKTVAYVMLAREGINVDGFTHIVNKLPEVAPLDYFTDSSQSAFRTDPNGFSQLVFEGILMGINALWNDAWPKGLDEVQDRLDLSQYLEDTAIFVSSSGKVFEMMLPA